MGRKVKSGRGRSGSAPNDESERERTLFAQYQFTFRALVMDCLTMYPLALASSLMISWSLSLDSYLFPTAGRRASAVSVVVEAGLGEEGGEGEEEDVVAEGGGMGGGGGVLVEVVVR